LLELPELIAHNVQDYVAKALQYGKDKLANQILRRHILTYRERLFEQQEPLEALTAFFCSLKDKKC
jgi:CRISPR-associated protein Csy1